VWAVEYVLLTASIVLLSVILGLASSKKIGRGVGAFLLWSALAILISLTLAEFAFPGTRLWIALGIGGLIGVMFFMRWYARGGV
jgi:Na+/H+-dicarboxylate symporter